MSMDERSVVAEVRRVTLRELRLWVREGWVQPAQGELGPVFDEVDVARVRLLCDLRKEMALPSDALPVVLALIDRLHGKHPAKAAIRLLGGCPKISSSRGAGPVPARR